MAGGSVGTDSVVTLAVGSDTVGFTVAEGIGSSIAKMQFNLEFIKSYRV